MADDVGGDPTKPVYPDGDDFITRFRKGSQYAFYVRYEPEGGPQFDQSLITVDTERVVVLDLNPQQITFREPFATSIRFTQRGGKVVERRGQLIKTVSISGTTGFTPLPKQTALPIGNQQPGRNGVIALQPSRGSLVPQNTQDLDRQLGLRSGFLAFHRLRYLFRLYGWECRRGNTHVTMNYIDTKNDEYWRIEPHDFTMTRRSPRGFIYDYSITFTCIEPSTSGAESAAVSLRGITDIPNDISSPSVRQTLNRLDEIGGSWLDGIKHLAGAAQIAVQGALTQLNAVTSFFADLNDLTTVVNSTGDAILAQFDTALVGLATQIGELVNAAASPVAAFEFDQGLIDDLNESYCEAQHLSDYLRGTYSQARTKFNTGILTTNSFFARGRAKQGTARALFQPSAGSVGSPDASPHTGRSGLQQVTDVQALASVRSVNSYVIYIGDTIFTLAQRILGDVNRFVDLVLLNNLQFPYIVSNQVSQLPGTLAWGQQILAPSTTANPNSTKPSSPNPLVSTVSSKVTATGTTFQIIDTSFVDEGLPGWEPDQWVGFTVTATVAGNVNTRVVVSSDATSVTVNLPFDAVVSVGTFYIMQLVQFQLGLPVPQDQLTFGVDLLFSFAPAAGQQMSPRTADLVIGSTGDLGLIRGIANWEQALNIRTRVEQGTLMLHPGFGVSPPIGRPFSDDLAIMSAADARASLLSDPRTSKVLTPKWSLDGDTWTFDAVVQPVGLQNSRPVSVTLP